MVTNDNEEELLEKRVGDSVLRLVQVIGETRQFGDMLRSKEEDHGTDILNGSSQGT